MLNYQRVRIFPQFLKWLSLKTPQSPALSPEIQIALAATLSRGLVHTAALSDTYIIIYICIYHQIFNWEITIGEITMIHIYIYNDDISVLDVC